MLNIDEDIFSQNLLLTQAYCEMQLANTDKSPAEILRSFNPDYEGKPVFSFGGDQYEELSWNTTIWSIDLLSSYINWCQILFDKQLEYKRNAVNISEEQSMFKGRILVAKIDETVCDGASEAQSDGLIDGDDYPPIDTWFYLEGQSGYRTLFAWIPEQFIPLAQDAIDVNCVDCLEWYEDWTKAPVTSNSRHPAYTRELSTNYQKATKGKLKPFYIGKYEFSWQTIVKIITFLMIAAWLMYNEFNR